VVLLIDEVDKADIEFPNDLLHELDQMSFEILETGETVRAVRRPAVIITSNSEKELPDAFLRRCVFHYIDFPDEAQMRAIVEVHFPGLPEQLLTASLRVFYSLREVTGFRKKPSTSELLDWIRVLLASGARPPEPEEGLEAAPFLGALVKMQEDAETLARHTTRSADPRTAGRRYFR
ncbi:MAG: AAA family ATPase, partial [Deferrisomatales bacterium]